MTGSWVDPNQVYVCRTLTSNAWLDMHRETDKSFVFSHVGSAFFWTRQNYALKQNQKQAHSSVFQLLTRRQAPQVTNPGSWPTLREELHWRSTVLREKVHKPVWMLPVTSKWKSIKETFPRQALLFILYYAPSKGFSSGPGGIELARRSTPYPTMVSLLLKANQRARHSALFKRYAPIKFTRNRLWHQANGSIELPFGTSYTSLNVQQLWPKLLWCFHCFHLMNLNTVLFYGFEVNK